MFETLAALIEDLGIEDQVRISRSFFPDRFVVSKHGEPVYGKTLDSRQALVAILLAAVTPNGEKK